MVNSTPKSGIIKRTNVLRVNKIPDSENVLTLARACESFVNDLKDLRIVKFKDGTRNALLEFISPRQCETIKETSKLRLSGQEYELFYSRANSFANYNVTASENKLYVKYPETVKEDDVVKMLGDIKVTKPDNARNYFFAVCRDIDQQWTLVRAFDNKPLGDGTLSVKVAIDKTKKRAPLRIRDN